jgi:Zn-dependent protease/CBS domain-containing protein
MNKSIRLGYIMGIPIEIDYSWFIIFFVLVWQLTAGFMSVLDTSPVISNLALGIVASLMFFFSLIAHELSHSIIATKNGLPIRKITLFIFGGVAQLEEEPRTPKVEFRMAIAGPLCSIALSLLFASFSYSFMEVLHMAGMALLCGTLSYTNMLLAMFNLIPAFPLDGGRVFRAAIWHFSGNLKRATQVSSYCGRLFALFLIGFGLFLIMNRTFSGIWYILIGFFLQEAASRSYKQTALFVDLKNISVKELMHKNVITVLENMPIVTFVDEYAFKYRFTSFPVLSSMGDIQGVITIHRIKDIPRDQWSNKCVGEAMIPIRRDLTVSPDTSAVDALSLMAGNDVGRLLVTDPQGKLLGIISQRDILRLFEVKEDLGD